MYCAEHRADERILHAAAHTPAATEFGIEWREYGERQLIVHELCGEELRGGGCAPFPCLPARAYDAPDTSRQLEIGGDPCERGSLVAAGGVVVSPSAGSL